MADDTEKDSKTEEPTEKRLTDALEREGGPSSREVGSATVLLITAVFLATASPKLVMTLAQSLAVYIEDPGNWRLDNGEDAVRLLQLTATIASKFLAVFVGSILVATLAA